MRFCPTYFCNRLSITASAILPAQDSRLTGPQSAEFEKGFFNFGRKITVATFHRSRSTEKLSSGINYKSESFYDRLSCFFP
jgi:hypothetical protein